MPIWSTSYFVRESTETPMSSSIEADEVLKKELSHGERLLWAGRPKQGFLLRRSDAFWIPFSLAWAGFAVFWEYEAIASGSPWLFRLWGIPFVLIGLYLVVGRFALDALERSKRFYGLTDCGAVIVTGLRAHRVERLDVHTVANATMSEKLDGTGTIIFGSAPPGLAGTLLRWPGTGQQLPPVFERIACVREVFSRIKEITRAG